MVKTKILQKLYLWAPVVLWSLLIFKFSSGKVPSVSDVYWHDFAFKKFGHFVIFGSLSLLIYRALVGEGLSRKNALITAILVATLYGASDEFHQTFTQGREARVRDIIIDGIGATFFTTTTYYLLPLMPKEIKMLGERFGFK